MRAASITLSLFCAKILLRVRVQDSRVRLLDFRKVNFEGMRRELGDVDWETNNRTISIREMGNLKGPNVQSKYIRRKEQLRTSVGPLRNITGRVVSDESEMAGLLNRYFSSTFTQAHSGDFQ